MDTIPYRAKINKNQIGFINSIIEGYDGIAVVRTLDPKEGILELWVSPFFEAITTEVMNNLAEEIGLEYYYRVLIDSKPS
jgi:hypothetical protein